MIDVETFAAAKAYTDAHGGEGGTSNYNVLENKPQINGVELSGNKTAEDLGLVASVEGKGLSTNDYTDEDKAIVDSVTGALAEKQDVLTFDDEPTANSNNPVKSGGVFDTVNTSPKTVEGNPVTFSDGIDIAAKNVTVTIEPSQEGTGDPSPTNVRPLIGFSEVDVNVAGFNIWDEEWEDGSYNSQGNPQSGGEQIRSKNYIPIAPNTTYYRHCGTDYNLAVHFFDINKSFLSGAGGSGEFTTPSNARFIRFYTGNGYGTTYNNNICINVSKTTGTPKNGDYVPYNGKTTTVQLGRTVYGGVLDVTNGKLTLTYGYKVFNGSESWQKNANYSFYLAVNKISPLPKALGNILCDSYKTDAYGVGPAPYCINMNRNGTAIQMANSETKETSDFKAALSENNVCLAYELATPEVIDLTQTEIDMLLGYNTISTNGTTLSLVYQPNNVLGVAEKYTDDKVKMAMSEITCQETTEGDYTLKATVDENGKVTYEWVAVTP